MAEGAIIDVRMRDALARLTDNEKECLRRRLRQQTAKEMALELGVSPHAVEKRLKMARAKLGLSSSLEAARLLAASEVDQRTVPHASDLAAAQIPSKIVGNQQRVLGAVVVILSMSAALGLVLQSSGNVATSEVASSPPSSHRAFPAGETPAPEAAPPRGPNGRPVVYKTYQPDEMVDATPTEIAMSITTTFAMMDADRSGFIEPDETMARDIELAPDKSIIERVIYRRDDNGNVEPTGEVRRIPVAQAQAELIALHDSDKDGRWDFVEYRKWMTPVIQQHGIPATWRADIEQTYAQAD